jgi:hypothetical protein
LIAAAAVISSSQMIALAFPALVGTCLLVRGLLLLAGKGPKPAPLSKINAITPGQAAIHGAASGPCSITAPISGKSCYLYRTAVWQQKKSPTPEWEKLADETLHVPFYLDDSTGQLLIEPLGADLAIPITLREEYAAAAFYGASTIPPAINVFLARHQITPTSRILIEESCIEPKADLFATGTVTDNPGVEVRPLSPRKAKAGKPNGSGGGQPQPDASEPEVIRLSDSTTPHVSGAMTQQSRIAAALTKAGIQNPNAWAAAGVPYPGPPSSSATTMLQDEPAPLSEREPAKTSEAVSGFNLKPPLVLMKGPDDAPFVLSTRSIQVPPRPSRWKALLHLSIGGTLALASLWIFLAKFLL